MILMCSQAIIKDRWSLFSVLNWVLIENIVEIELKLVREI